jgi:hypothetical protein
MSLTYQKQTTVNKMIQPSRKRVSQTASLEAPTAGLNAKDPIANMNTKYAVTMDDWFPTPSSVDVRNGYESYATGLGASVETLAFYSSGTDQELFGAAGGNIYDVTAQGAVGAAVVSGQTNARWQSINMGTAGGFFLLMVNGDDKLLRYTGSAWQVDGDGSADITGVDTADCIHINNFKNRLFLIEKDSFNLWYLPVASIGGAATKFDLSGIFKLGGYLMAMANWTIDNTAGIDDYAAFISSNGEVAIYSGIDPSSATDWLLEGTFRMGSPIGRRCFIKVGADVMVLTVDGAFPLSKSMLTDRTQLGLALTDKISPLINQDIRVYKDNFGWQPIYYPLGNKLIINVPIVEGASSRQYVMNTQHGAWTRFTGWDKAICFELLNDELFFGGDGVVYRADYGQSDNGAEIQSVCQQAFSYFGARGTVKKFSLVRPVFLAEGIVTPAVLINTDFQENRTTNSPTFSGGIGEDWDDGSWDEFDWAGGDVLTAKWQSVTAVGYSAGIRVVTSIKGISCKWQATDFVFERGQVL